MKKGGFATLFVVCTYTSFLLPRPLVALSFRHSRRYTTSVALSWLWIPNLVTSLLCSTNPPKPRCLGQVCEGFGAPWGMQLNPYKPPPPPVLQLSMVAACAVGSRHPTQTSSKMADRALWDTFVKPWGFAIYPAKS